MKHLYLFDQKGSASAYGVGTYIQNVVSACSELSISVTVVSLNALGDTTVSVSKEGVRYISIPCLKTNEGEAIDMEQKEESEKYCHYVIAVLQQYISITDNLIFHLNYTQDYFLADSLKKQWQTCKLVLTVHYFTWCFALQGNVSYLTTIANKKSSECSEFEAEVIYSSLFEQKLFQIVDRIICLSHFAEEVLEDYYEIATNKLVLISNGLTDKYQKVDKKALRKYYNIPLEEKMILFVGRLNPIKGVQPLIEAFKIVANKYADAHLYIVGDGRFGEYLPICNPIWKRITFCGKLPAKQVYDFYQMSDIGTIPSMHEQCSYVAIEMMMHGLPIVGSTSTGLDEMIENGVNGNKVCLREEEHEVIVPVNELSELIIKLLNPDLLKEYALQSREFYLNKYTNNQMKDKLNELYSNLFSKGKDVAL